MISVNKLSLTTIEKVELGHLVLCDSSESWKLAIRIEAPGADAKERLGLLCLRHESRRESARSPYVFGDCGSVRCIDLGIPQFAWFPDLSAEGLENDGAGFSAGALSIRADDVGIATLFGRSPGAGWWSVNTGKQVSSPDAELRILKWAVGVMDIDGRFKALLRYPDHFAAVASKTG